MKLFENIIQKPQERLTTTIIERINNPDVKFDTHVHLFDIDYIPDDFLSVRFPTLVDVNFLKNVDSLLDFVDDTGDELYNYAFFIDYISKNKISEIADYLITNSPQNTIFFNLLLDFHNSFSHKIKFRIGEMFQNSKNLDAVYDGHFLHFLGINPENPKCFELFEKAFSEKNNFVGLKIYPALGYMPSHPNLMKIFEVCQQYNIPVVSHTNIDAAYSSRNIIKLVYFEIDSTGKLFLKKETKRFFFGHQYNKFFNRPQLWEPVLKAFPNLRLNLAHFDCDFGDNTQRSTNFYRLIDLMERFPNVYSDTSYVLSSKNYSEKFLNFYDKISIVRDRVMYGSDFHFVNIQGKYKNIRSKFVMDVGTSIMQKISVINPLKYLDLYNFVNEDLRKKWEQQTS